MDQFLSIFFSLVDMHDIYYILKIHNQIWCSLFKKNKPFLTRMTQNWKNNYYKKSIWLKISKKIYKRCYQWLCICRENIIQFKIICAIWYRGSKLVSHVVFNLTMEWPPPPPVLHSDGFSHTITQAHVVWRNYLVGVKCHPMQSHVFCGSRIHTPFPDVLWMGSVLYCHCEFVIILHIFSILFLLVICYVTKSCNVVPLATIETLPYTLPRRWIPRSTVK